MSIEQLGTTQSGTKNLFAGAEVFALASQASPFVGVVRLVITRTARTNPSNWIIRVTQGTSVEEWSGQTAGNASVVLTLDDVFFIDGSAISITLENDEPLDTAVTVDASLFVSTVAAELADLTTEISKVPRADSPIAAGKYRWDIEGGQSANITPGAPE
jgi:hypothetical protein